MVGRPFFGSVLCIRRRYRGFFSSLLVVDDCGDGMCEDRFDGWVVGLLSDLC